MGFGNKLAEIRKRKGISQVVFAERVGLNVSHLSRIEKEKQIAPRLEIAFRMIQVLKLTREEGIDLLQQAGYPSEYFTGSLALAELESRREIIESIETIQAELDLLKKRLLDETLKS